MVDIQTVSVGIAAIGLFIAGVNSVLSSRREDKQRQTELFMNLYAVYNDPEFSSTWANIIHYYEWEDLDDFLQKYGRFTSNPEIAARYYAFVRYLEGIGVLVQDGMIDIKMVDKLLGRNIRMYWEKYESLTYDMRKRYPYGSQISDHIEYLYNELKKQEQ